MGKAQHLRTSAERPRGPPEAPPFWPARNPTPARACPQQVPTPCGDPGRLGSRGRTRAPVLEENHTRTITGQPGSVSCALGPTPGWLLCPGWGGGHDYCFLTDEASFLLGASDHLTCYFIGVHPPSPPMAKMSASATLAPCLASPMPGLLPHRDLCLWLCPLPAVLICPPPAWLSPSPSSRTGSTHPFSRRHTPSILPTAVPPLHSQPPLSCCAAPFIPRDESSANTVHNVMLTKGVVQGLSPRLPPHYSVGCT